MIKSRFGYDTMKNYTSSNGNVSGKAGSTYTNQRQVRQERTGWRDQALSERHREYGWDCPMVDFDCIEYDHGVPVAFIEYKRHNATLPPKGDSKLKALRIIADRCRLPLYIVQYWDDTWAYHVIPINDWARRFVPEEADMSEREYVTLIYQMRERDVPADVLSRMGNERPPVAFDLIEEW